MRRFNGLVMAAVLALGLMSCTPKPTGPLPDDMTLGDPKAKVTVVEYASVGCPICGQWQREVYPAFKAKYIDTGTIHFVSREMLVGGGAEVAVAASGFVLARCAGKDRYFAVTDAIYKAQPGVFDAPRETLLAIAKSVGSLSEAQFNACINNDAALLALNKRVEEHVKQGIDGTPTFVINGKALPAGYHPLAELDAAIAEARAKP